MLARCAREGAQIYLVIATDGMQGFGSGTFIQRVLNRRDRMRPSFSSTRTLRQIYSAAR